MSCADAALRVGIFGGAQQGSQRALQQAEVVGRLLAQAGAVVVTGATSGIPYTAGKAALKAGGFVLGISPGKDAQEHLYRYKRPLDGCSQIVWTGHGFTGRNYLNVRNCDAAVFIGGAWGTLEELCIAVYEGKVVGVLEGSGGICDQVRSIQAAADTLHGAELFYRRAADELVSAVLEAAGRRAGQEAPGQAVLGR